MAYDRMASVYDALMRDAPYHEWLRFAEEVFGKSEQPINRIADLGCGTGQLTSHLAKAGYDMTGIDLSEDMLSYAEQRASEQGVRIQWLKQDLRTLEGFLGYDAVVSFCDVINYMTTEDEVKQVFGSAHQMLRDGGLFLFDVHSLYHVTQHLADETFATVTDELTSIWFCDAGDNVGEVFHDLTFFTKENEKYVRFDEYHHQRTFPIETYKKLLAKAGFEICHLYGDFSLESEKLHEQTERIFFVAKKQPQN